MKFPRFRGLSLFAQTLILLVTTLVATTALLITLIVVLPETPPNFVGVSDVAEALEPDVAPHLSHSRKEGPRLIITRSAAPPIGAAAMTSDPALTADLAQRLGVPAERVRLFFEADEGRQVPFADRWPGDLVPRIRGEALFFNEFVAGAEIDGRWLHVTRATQEGPDPGIMRLILLVGANFTVLLPFAWFFARRLSRPIRQFAVAADRLGRGDDAAALPLEGPAELRTTAQAVNNMQARISAFVRERTAMIGAIAHDLRTPLARIAFRIENADDALRTPIQNDIDQMREMISATLSFVKSEAQPKSHVPVDLGLLLARLAESEASIGRNVALSGRRTATIDGDPVSLQRLFQNLVDNAVAFGGAAEIELRREGGAALIEIADRGPGLPEDKLETVFDPFVRIEPSRNRATGGVGLGLTIARMIAIQHGGRLTLANREGGGLTATVTLEIGTAQ